jgi:coproporphyrinogen III oxidase-like Fe-S oxidoreductase
MSKTMMQRSFKKSVYNFAEIPKASLSDTFGIYIHVPFCYSKCSFCPFYKELYSQSLKEQYMIALQKEIDDCRMTGTAHWVYFGGGTPNTLDIADLAAIVQHLNDKVTLHTVGIELLPALVTREYLEGLKTIGFTKISVGVESFAEAMNKTGRKTDTPTHIEEILKTAQSENLWTNVDIMVGLPGQDSAIFLDDIKAVSRMSPDQITIYPFMTIRGVTATGSMPEIEQFELIEQASKMLSQSGYARKGVWTFAKGDDVYDSSRDELIQDYIGFGPAAFSTYGGWKIVNPGLSGYLRDTNERMGFIAPKSKKTDDWRKFARMVYDLTCESSEELPSAIQFFVWLLGRSGYCKNGYLTKKGILFAHAITKTVVESLPFPLQNPDCVENYDEYITYTTEKKATV